MPCVDVGQFHLDQVFHHGVSGRQPASQKVGHHIHNLLVESGESQHLLLNLKLKEKIFNKCLNHIQNSCALSKSVGTVDSIYAGYSLLHVLMSSLDVTEIFTQEECTNKKKQNVCSLQFYSL